jgi:hypothetical protein
MSNDIPSSAARLRFDESCLDIERLLEIHADVGGVNPGRRRRLEVLNKSAVVLLCAFWEAYCEDLAAEAVRYLVQHAADAGQLAKDLRKSIAHELHGAPNELAMWDLADEGWRRVLQTRLDRLQEERNRNLNTPKSQNVDDLFARAIGNKVSGSWRWKRMSSEQARTKLDNFVSLRGDIAHRGRAANAVQRRHVVDALAHVRALVAKTDEAIWLPLYTVQVRP